MGLAGLAAFLLMTATAEPGTQRPSLAVFEFPSGEHVSPALAQAVTELTLLRVRESGHFSRVVTTKDAQEVLGLERQRQLLDCDAASCMTELAQSLGVDNIMTGEISRVGRSVLLSFRLLDVKHARLLATASQRVTMQGDEAVLDAVPPTVDRLFRDAGLERKASSSLPLPVLRIASSALAAGSVVFALASAGLVVGAVATQVVPRLVPLPWLGLPYNSRLAVVYTSGAATVTLAGVAGTIALIVGAAGVGLMVRA
ncbi:MAG: hypothetical protein AB2A00_02270 [Myxococcota bacterium]